MRLDKFQRHALKQALRHLNPGDEAFLFGSRVNENARGGDVDVLIFSRQPSFELSRKITRDYFKNCEEKIDVVVINPQAMTEEQSLFVKSIDREAIVDL
ncbi:MAG TPA: DNA polymerase III subunit beta [Methylococcaceae bacterium]|nr:DNA polymerase III subunit beta [Methylococcaceae bacterium]